MFDCNQGLGVHTADEKITKNSRPIQGLLRILISFSRTLNKINVPTSIVMKIA